MEIQKEDRAMRAGFRTVARLGAGPGSYPWILADKDQKILVYRPPVADPETRFALDAVADEPELHEIAVQKEQFERIWAELAGIPERELRAVVLWAIGLSFSGIAYVLGITESHARSLKDKALRALKYKIQGDSSDVRVRPCLENTQGG
jgi:DNA-directed RNA polymerase specialized sigma24 family protein